MQMNTNQATYQKLSIFTCHLKAARTKKKKKTLLFPKLRNETKGLESWLSG